MASENGDSMKMVKCYVCGKEKTGKTILLHITKSKGCQSNYPEDKLQEHRDRSAAARKEKITLNNRKRSYDSAAKSKENKNDYQKNKKRRLEKDKVNYQRNKQTKIEKSKQRNKTVRIEERECMRNFDEKIYIKFFKECKQAPIFACVSCMRCFCPSGVMKLAKKFLNELQENKLTEYINLDDTLKMNGHYFICHTCYRSLKKKDLPNLCFRNGLELAKVPPCLQVGDLGNQLLAKHLVFIKIRHLPKTRMQSMYDR